MEGEKKYIYIYIMVLSREIKQEWTILELITWKSVKGRSRAWRGSDKHLETYRPIDGKG